MSAAGPVRMLRLEKGVAQYEKAFSRIAAEDRRGNQEFRTRVSCCTRQGPRAFEGLERLAQTGMAVPPLSSRIVGFRWDRHSCLSAFRKPRIASPSVSFAPCVAWNVFVIPEFSQRFLMSPRLCATWSCRLGCGHRVRGVLLERFKPSFSVDANTPSFRETRVWLVAFSLHFV